MVIPRTSGIVFDIKHFAIHDGPGIRTTVFFKGCPLRCPWCHNPEGLADGPELVFYADNCMDCGACIEACPNQCAVMGENGPCVSERCNVCGTCAEKCPSRARAVIGKEVDYDFILREILKDSVFYQESGGGVTFSGGEPLFQPGFLLRLLDECKRTNIHTALDTSGHAPWEILNHAAGMCDLVLYDIKHIDDEKHMQWTGRGNALILENLERLLSMGIETIGRIPVIPGFNDHPDEIRDMARFLEGMKPGLKVIHILPYHRGYERKKTALKRKGREITANGILKPPGFYAGILEEKGFEVRIGG